MMKNATMKTLESIVRMESERIEMMNCWMRAMNGASLSM
jgi:hypothetical protein